MTKINRGPFALLAATGLLLLSSSAFAANGDAAVQAVTEHWAAAYGRSDLKEITGLYTADARLLPEGAPAVSGREAIGRWFEQNLRAGLPGTISFTGYEIYAGPQSAASVSNMVMRDAKGEVQLRGKQIVVLLKQNGQWKIHRDIWTTDGQVKP